MRVPTPRDKHDNLIVDDHLERPAIIDCNPEPHRDPARQHFQDAVMSLYDRLRVGSRAQADHAADMILGELGGTFWMQIPHKASKRTLPEAGYSSETPTGLRLG